jgi:hypothetical protein
MRYPYLFIMLKMYVIPPSKSSSSSFSLYFSLQPSQFTCKCKDLDNNLLDPSHGRFQAFGNWVSRYALRDPNRMKRLVSGSHLSVLYGGSLEHRS